MADDKKKNNNDDLLNKVLSNIIEDKGGSVSKYRELMDKIAWHESAHTMDPTIHQIGGGPGRGVYQFEGNTSRNASNRILDSATRTKRYFEMKGMDVPDFINNILENGTGDASKLSRAEQDILFMSDLRMKGGLDLKDYADDKLSVGEIWADHWWIGHKGDPNVRQKNIQKFNDSIKGLKIDEDNYNNFSEDEVYNRMNEKSSLRSQEPPFNPTAVDNTAVNKPTQYDRLLNAPEPDFSTSDINYKNDRNFYTPGGIGSMRIDQPVASNQQPHQVQEGEDPNNLKYNASNHTDRIQQYMTSNPFSMGGMLNQGMNKGDFNMFNEGGTHEQNVNGGIPQGMGQNGRINTTEEDETTFEFEEGKYVFSDRIGVDYKAKDFNKKNENQFALGGFTNECGGPGQPPCKEMTKQINDSSTVKFTDQGANQLFTNVDSNNDKYQGVNLGKYADPGYYNVQRNKNQVSLIPTSNNPHSMESMNQILPYFYELNPGMDITYNYNPRGKRK